MIDIFSCKKYTRSVNSTGYMSVNVPIIHSTGVQLIHLKSISICGVRIYQRFAPDSIRNKCRFEPSCSEYMILSIQKYGVIHGIRKGINRLKRCNIHNGGYDTP